MAIRFFCPLGHRLKVPDERAGKKGRCPICHQRLVVPDVSIDEAARSGQSSEADGVEDSPGSNSALIFDDRVAPSDATEVGSVPLSDTGHAAPAVAPPQAMPSQLAPSIDEAPLLVLACDEKSLLDKGEIADAARQESNDRQGQGAGPRAFASNDDNASGLGRMSAPGSAIAVSPPPLPAAVSRNGIVPGEAPRQDEARLPPREVRWAVWARGDRRESFAISRPTPRQMEVVYWLACLLPFAAVFCAAPAVPHMQFAGAPAWAQALLCIAGLQFAYAAWLAMLPDWSTVRVGMYLFGAVATFDLLTAIACPVLPESSLSLLGLAGMRATASAWCVLSAVVTGVASLACRWIAHRWRAGRL